MTGRDMQGDESRFRERIVKSALGNLDFAALASHLDQIVLTQESFTQLCGHIRRESDFICKYPRKEFEHRRSEFLALLLAYAEKHLGADAAKQVSDEAALISQIEHGYRRILDSLKNCDISRHPAEVRVSAAISRSCHSYQDLLNRRDLVIAESKELSLNSDMRVPGDDGSSLSPDSVLAAISNSVAMTIVMEATKNKWLCNKIVVLPEIVEIDDSLRYQAGSNEYLSLCWRQWQLVDQRRRFLGGMLKFYSGDELPAGLPDKVKTAIEYTSPDKGYSDLEVYDYIANKRLLDRIFQAYIEMEIEEGVSATVVGIAAGTALPPKQLVSTEEAHAGFTLSEILGYSITEDDERPEGLRLLEWVRGYIILKEIAKKYATATATPDEKYAIRLAKADLVRELQTGGLFNGAAERFIELTSLHQSSRDMFDCPLVCIGSSGYLLFAPSVFDANIAAVVLSNLSNRGAGLAKKGKAFENAVHRALRKHGLKVFTFRVHRDGKEFEYDAVVPWDRYLFVFECKNRSLSGNDPTQAYYFNLEVTSQAKQVRRLADALVAYPEIIEQEIGVEYKNYKIIPCILHSLPYSRPNDSDGVLFTDWSVVTRFFDQSHFRVKVFHQIGKQKLLHRIALKKLWKSETPSADDLLNELRSPFQLELSKKLLSLSPVMFPISTTEVVISSNITREEMTVPTVCRAMGINVDKIQKEISAGEKIANTIRDRRNLRNENGSHN